MSEGLLKFLSAFEKKVRPISPVNSPFSLVRRAVIPQASQGVDVDYADALLLLASHRARPYSSRVA